MILRIVRMTFQEEEVSEFLHLFDLTKHKIRHFPGCSHLELLKDAQHNHILTTYSMWDEESDLENYRKSDLFREVWAETKKKFSDKPLAFSMKRFLEVN